jgi:hypothetical protein
VKIPRVLVGTMYSGEEEYKECIILIKQQQNVNIDHFTVANKPIIEAHHLLYNTWNINREKYDFFVKIDADMLIYDFSLYYRIFEQFENTNITGFQLSLLDYYTNNFIFGTHFYKKSVHFNLNQYDWKTPDIDVAMNNSNRIDLKNITAFSPCGYHCKYPNNYQAFHFGSYRMIKKQNLNIISVYYQWKIYNDLARFDCLVGAFMARNLKNNFGYSNNEFKKIFDNIVINEELINNVINFCENMEFRSRL